MQTKNLPKVRPVILAGGRGTRLRPRTDHLPKPLLPLAGRPILWYVYSVLDDPRLQEPITTVDYKAKLLKAYFERDQKDFRLLPSCTMAEAFLKIVEVDDSIAFLGMSSNVLLPSSAVNEILNDFYDNGLLNTVLFTRLPMPGHKKWEFRLSKGFLEGLEMQRQNTNCERILLILRRDSMLRVSEFLPRPIEEQSLPEFGRAFRTGWILLLKTLPELQIPIRARQVDLEVFNINVPSDFEAAESFVFQHER